MRNGSQTVGIPAPLAGYESKFGHELSHEKTEDHRTPLRVLLVEDDPQAAALFSKTSAKSELFSIEITYCANWENAMKAIAESDFDVLVIDLWLNNASTIPIIELFAEAGRGKPVIILSNLKSGDTGPIANLAGATGILSRGDVSAEALDAILLRMRQISEPKQAPTDLDSFGTGDTKSGFTQNLKDVMLTLDAIHAHAAVASGALLKGNQDDIAKLLAHTIESAAEARRTLFGLVSELQRQQIGLSTVHGVIDASKLLCDAVELMEHDAEIREIGLIFRRSNRSVWVECDETAFRHMVETLLASVIWKAESRTSVQLEAILSDRFELKMRYQSSREIRIVDFGSGDAAVHAALSDLDRQAAKFGGTVSVEPEGKFVIARLTLPVQGGTRADISPERTNPLFG